MKDESFVEGEPPCKTEASNLLCRGSGGQLKKGISPGRVCKISRNETRKARTIQGHTGMKRKYSLLGEVTER